MLICNVLRTHSVLYIYILHCNEFHTLTEASGVVNKLHYYWGVGSGILGTSTCTVLKGWLLLRYFYHPSTLLLLELVTVLLTSWRVHWDRKSELGLDLRLTNVMQRQFRISQIFTFRQKQIQITIWWWDKQACLIELPEISSFFHNSLGFGR